jgi:hypothetical protein
LGDDRRVVNRMGDHRLHPYAHPENCKVLLCLIFF